MHPADWLVTTTLIGFETLHDGITIWKCWRSHQLMTIYKWVGVGVVLKRTVGFNLMIQSVCSDRLSAFFKKTIRAYWSKRQVETANEFPIKDNKVNWNWNLTTDWFPVVEEFSVLLCYKMVLYGSLYNPHNEVVIPTKKYFWEIS